MQQIRCPHCGEVFTIDESNYESIVRQIRNHEFSEELERRSSELKRTMDAQIELMKAETEHSFEQQLAEKQSALDETRHQMKLMESDYSAKMESSRTELEKTVASLENRLKLAESEKESALREMSALKEKENSEEIFSLQQKIAELNHRLEAQQARSRADLDAEIEKNRSEVALLKNTMESREREKQLLIDKAIAEITEEKNSEIQEYRIRLETQKNEAQLREESLRDSFNETLASKDREIASQKELVQQYKDFKVRQSTKMVGESLEQHCSYEFNRNRMGMFPRAYFEKDNDARTGSKGDFIFKDYAEDGTEIISIMFEMKNENETTATKHRNEDFLKELDKDRREKNCEYAILVSMLEIDNDLYNEGIVDVSYRYPKMYVVRPQFFIPIITILRNAALNAAEYKHQLMVERNNNLDIARFEENMNAFKDAFARNYDLASKKFQQAIEEIDKTIDHLQKTKDALLSSDRNLRLANNKAQDLTIKRLTKNAPSLAEKFEEQKKGR